MGCRRTGSFLDLPMILGCGHKLCQILASSTWWLPPQKSDLIQRTQHHSPVLCQILFSGESLFEYQFVHSHRSSLFVAVSILFLCVWPEIRQKFIRFSSFFRIISSDSVFFTYSSSAFRLKQNKWNFKSYGFRTFTVAAPLLWNSLPLEVKSSPSLNVFKSKLKTHLFKCAFNLN